MCPALVLLRLVDHDSIEMKALLCVLLVVIGLCITLTLEPLLAGITYLAGSLGEGEKSGRGSYAQAYSLFNIAWALGDTVGPTSCGFIESHAGWKTVTWSLGLLGGVSALSIVLWCGGWILRKNGES
jgi:MFS family permease